MNLKNIKQKLQNQLSDKSFSEILTGSAVALGARVAAAGLALISSLIVARIYGAEATGLLAIVQTLMMLFSIFSVMGTNVSILRLIPEHIAKYSFSSAYYVYKKILKIVVFTSLFISAVCFASSGGIAGKIFSKPHYSYAIGITAIFVIARAMMDFNTEAVRGLKSIRVYALMLLVPHVAMLVTLLLLSQLVGSQYDPIYAQMTGWGTAGAVGVLLVTLLFKKRIKSSDDVEKIKIMQILELSTPMLVTASMNFIVSQVGILILGIYRPSSEVGYYSIAVKLAMLTTFVLQAINSMAAPKFSELFHTGNVDELFRVAKKSTKLIFWSTSPILAGLIVFGPFALSLFGNEFTDAYIPLLILLAGQFVNSVSGSTGYFMSMTGHQVKFRNIICVSSAINLCLSFVLIPAYGLIGAALSAATCLIFWNAWILLFIKLKYGKSIGYMPVIG